MSEAENDGELDINAPFRDGGNPINMMMLEHEERKALQEESPLWLMGTHRLRMPGTI